MQLDLIRQATDNASELTQSKTLSNKKTTVKKNRPDVKQIISAYQLLHPRARPGVKACQLIAERIDQEGWTVRDCLEAIAGCHASPFHCCKNDRGQVYQSLSLIFRSSENVQRFIEIYERRKATLDFENHAKSEREKQRWEFRQMRARRDAMNQKRVAKNESATLE